MNMIDCINVNLLTPYVDKMVSDFLDTSPADPKVHHTVGMLIGLYSICEVCFSPIWGSLADRIGRKPVLLVGLGGSVFAPILFGMGTSLPTVFIARGLDGVFCGNMGVTRTYLGEIVDESTETRGFGFLAVCFSLGLFIGPLLGGELVEPVKMAPSIFAGTIFESHPYLLPNLTYAIFAAIAWIIGALFLEETLPRESRRSCCARDEARIPLSRSSSWSGTDPRGMPSSFPMEPEERSSIASWCGRSVSRRCYSAVLLQVILAYCVLSGAAAAMSQLFVLVVSFPVSDAGFGFGPREIGALQNVAAVGVMLTQLVLYPRLTKCLGLFRCFILGFSCYITAYALLPVYALFADPDIYGIWHFAPLIVMQLLSAVGGGMCFPTAFAFINRASVGFDKGAVNGWASSLGALTRGLVPPAAGWMLGCFTKRPDLPDSRYLALHIILVIAALAMALAAPGLKAADRLSAGRAPLVRNQSNSLVQTDNAQFPQGDARDRAQPLVGAGGRQAPGA